MRKLTFKGFLTQYVRQLSEQKTNGLYKLAAEAGSSNPRLREPLFLYATYSQKQKVLLRATKNLALYAEYDRLASQYKADRMTELLEQTSELLPAEYHKVWRSYQSQKNRGKADNHTKELMRKKIRGLQERTGVSTYRIYTDLKLNPGNLNAWLKHGDSDKVSLDTARRVLRYMQSRGENN